MGILDSIKSLGTSIVNAGKYVVSEFITNKDLSKGILDFDKYQEYQKMLSAPGLEEVDAMNISKKMVDENIIDPGLYDNAMKKSAEQAAKYESKSDKQTGEQVYNFRNQLTQDITENYKQGDKYQRDVITKAVDELTSQYQMLADNVNKTLEDTDSPELQKQWDELRPEYETLIRDSAKTYAKYINQGLTFNEAYKKLIDEGKDKANRIVQIQNKLSNTMYWKTGVIGNIKEAQEHFRGENNRKGGLGGLVDEITALPKGLFDLGKALMNTVSGGLQLVGQGIEEGKQLAGGYDVLEELNNLNIYKDSGPVIDKRRTLKSWGYEIVDGLPQIAPSVAAIIFGNKTAGLLKLDEAMSLLVGGGKFIEGAAAVTKRGKFISESIQDLLMMDMVAQPIIGRPITTKDFQENWMFNLPVNAFVASIVRSGKLIGTLPEGALASRNISPNVLKLISEGKKSDEDIIKYAFAEKKAVSNANMNTVIDEMGDIEGVQTKTKLNLNPVTEGMKESIDVNSLPQHIQDKVDAILQGLGKYNEEIKLGKTTLTDSLLNQTLEKTIKSDGGTLGFKSGEEINVPNEVFKRVDDLTDGIQNGTPRRLVTTKVQQAGLVNLYKSGFVTKEELLPIIDSVKEGIGKDMLNALWKGDKAAQKKVLTYMNSVVDSKDFVASLESTYQDIMNKVIVRGEQKGLIKQGTQIGNFRYIGEGKRWDILSGTTLTREELLKPISYIKDKNIVVNTTVFGRSDYFNYSIPGALQDALNKSSFNTVQISHVFSLDKSNKLIQDLDTYKGVKTWLGNQFRELNIKFETGPAKLMVSTLTTTDQSARKLLDTAKSLQEKGFNIAELTKDELAVYKLIHIKEYLEAMLTSEMKSGDFKAWFEKLYKEEGGILKLDMEKFNISDVDKKELMIRSSEHDFPGIEIKSSQIITKQGLTDVLDSIGKEFNLDSFITDSIIASKIDTYVEDLKYTPLYNTMKSAIIGAVRHINLAGKEKNLFLEGYAQAIGGLLGDWQSRKYLTKLFADSTEEFKIGIIQSFIARNFSRNIELRSGLIKNIGDRLAIIAKEENAEHYRGVEELIDSMNIMDRQFLNVSPQLRAGFMFQFEKFITNEIKKTYNSVDITRFRFERVKLNKLAIAQKIQKEGELDVLTMSDKDILDIANLLTYNSLHKYNLFNKDIIEIVSSGTYNMLKNFKARAAKYLDIIGGEKIGGKAKISFGLPPSIGHGEKEIILNIKDYSELQILGILANKDKWFKHLSIHEITHVDQFLGGKKIFNMYAEVLGKLKKCFEDIIQRTDESFFGYKYYEQTSEYFYDFKINKQNTVEAQRKINDMLQGLSNKIETKTFILQEFSEQIQQLYKIYEGKDTKTLFIIKEALAEALAQFETFYKIGLSKEDFDSLGQLISNAQILLDDMESIFMNIGKNYSKSEIQDVLGFQLPRLEDAITGESLYTPPVIYNNTLSNVANTGFLGEHFIKLAKGKTYDDAIVKWNTIFDKAHKVYNSKSIPKTISINGLERVIRKTIGGYSHEFVNGLSVILGKKGLVFDIRDLFIKESDIKNFDTLYKNEYKHIDEYILNKIVANVLGSKAEYNEAAIDYLNKAVYVEKLNLEISNLAKNESTFTKQFINALDALKENTEGLTVFTLKKALGGDKKFQELMESFTNYMVNLYHVPTGDTKVLDDMLRGLKQKLKPIFVYMYDEGIKKIKDTDGNIIGAQGAITPEEFFGMQILNDESSVIDDIVNYIWNTLSNDSNVFKYNSDLIDKGQKPLGLGKGFEYNGLLLIEGLFEKKAIKASDIKKLGQGNGHFEKMFSKYGLNRNNPADVYSYIKRSGIKEAWNNKLLTKPIDITFSDGDMFKKVITLEPGANKSVQLLKSFLDFINSSGKSKTIAMKGDEIGVNLIAEGDATIQLTKFLQGPVGSHILDDLNISKYFEPEVPKELITSLPANVAQKITKSVDIRKQLGLPPYTEQELKNIMYKATGNQDVMALQLRRQKESLQILDELKDYFGKPLDLSKGFKYLSQQQKDNKYIFNKLANILKVGEYDINTYVEGIMNANIIKDGVNVGDQYKILGIRVPFVTVTKEGDTIITGLSNGFISNSKQIADEHNLYQSDIFTNADEVSDEGWKLVSEGYTHTKVDFDNDTFDVMFSKNGEVLYGKIKKNQKVYEIIDGSIVKKKDLLDADVQKIKEIRKKNISASDEIKKWMPNYKETIDNVGDDFKC